MILGVGLGHPGKVELTQFGEEADDGIRAVKLDEGLDILTGLWQGKPFRYQGTHYHIQKTTFLPPALQTPRIPIWVAGFWPHTAPFRRAACWDGVVPLKRGGLQPVDIEKIVAFLQEHRTSKAPFDIIKIGTTPEGSPAKRGKTVVPYAATGATWWLESLFTKRNSFEQMRQRIRQGPPVVL